MFLIRSAFWLTLAFLVIRPGVDMGDHAANLSSDAMARGSQFITQQIDAISCDSFACIGGKAMASAALRTHAPAADSPEGPAARSAIPLPRPRPDRTG